MDSTSNPYEPFMFKILEVLVKGPCNVRIGRSRKCRFRMEVDASLTLYSYCHLTV